MTGTTNMVTASLQLHPPPVTDGQPSSDNAQSRTGAPILSTEFPFTQKTLSFAMSDFEPHETNPVPVHDTLTGQGLGSGIIAGIAIGSFAGFSLVSLVAVRLYRRRGRFKSSRLITTDGFSELEARPSQSHRPPAELDDRAFEPKELCANAQRSGTVRRTSGNLEEAGVVAGSMTTTPLGFDAPSMSVKCQPPVELEANLIAKSVLREES